MNTRLVLAFGMAVVATAMLMASSHSAATVEVVISQQTTATSRLDVGVTHTQYSADEWNEPAAVRRAEAVLRARPQLQNQHIMGFGVDNPNPAPGVYDWDDLDSRMSLIRRTDGVPVLTLCCAPDWMKGGTPGATDWHTLEVAPLPEHYGDFADLAARVAARYRDVRHFIVWNELKGFYDPHRNRWNHEEYTRLYNSVYDAVKRARPDALIGGPYVVLDSSDPHGASHPSAVSGPWGALDQRGLDAIEYWLEHKHGADFVAVDAGTMNHDGTLLTDRYAAADKFAVIGHWLRGRTDLPLWMAEFYTWPGRIGWGKQSSLHLNAVAAMARSGWSHALLWEPQTRGMISHYGALWVDTRRADGGRPLPLEGALEAFADAFPPGTPLRATAVSSEDLTVLASARHALLVNRTGEALNVRIDDGGDVTRAQLPGHGVRVVGLHDA